MKFINLITTIIFLSFFSIANAQTNSRELNIYEYAAMCVSLMGLKEEAVGKNTQEGKIYGKLGLYFTERLQYGLQNNHISTEKAGSVVSGTLDQIRVRGGNSEIIRGVTDNCLETAKRIGVIDSIPQSSQSQPQSQPSQPQANNQLQPQQPFNTNQTLTYSHGKYVGEVMNGKAHGNGTYTSANSGTVYTGQFIADTFSGDGTMSWTNGSKFVGKWQNDVGISGTMTYTNGSTTSGVVRSGVFTPSATQSSAQQSTIVWNHNTSKMKIDMFNNTINIFYSQPRQAMLDAGAKPNDLLVNGTIQNNQITGTARIFAGRCGQFTYPVTGNIFNNGREISLNGQAPVVNLSNCQVTRYVPDLLSFNVIQTNSQSNSQPQPSPPQANTDVKINYTNGDTYFGQVKDGKPNGQGTFAWSSGGRYVGEFKNGLRNGQGTLTFKDGGRYVGEFKNDQRHGQGTSTFREGSSYVGEFKDDKFNGQGTLTLKDVSRYVGGWKDGKKNGQGTLTSNTSSYVGEFKDDDYNGRGTLTSTDIYSYDGEFKDNKMNGRGTLTDKDGTKIVGLFKDGFPVGPQTNSQPPQSQANTEVEKLQSEIIKIQKEIESLQKERLILSDVIDAPRASKESLAVNNVTDVVKLKQTLKILSTTRDIMRLELESDYSLTATLKVYE